MQLTSPQSIAFGFTKDTITSTNANSGHDAAVTLTLYWNTTIYECTIPKDPNGQIGGGNTTFTCNSPTIIGRNEKEEYKMKLFYDHNTMFRPTEIHVIDSGNTYTIDTFCGPIQFYYWDNADEYLCDGYSNRYSYDYLEFSTRSGTELTTLYVSFIDDILSYPNMTLSGSVSPAKVSNFIVTTASDSNSGNSDNVITLRLYWDTDLFLCTLLLQNPSTSYICNVSDTSQVQSHCTDESYESSNNSLFALFALFIQNNDVNGVAIDSISVNDESGYHYEIDTFCQDNRTQYSQDIEIGINQTLNWCDDFGNNSLYQYEAICIDYTQNEFPDCMKDNEIIAVEFSEYLFENSYQSGFIYPVNTLNSLQCNNSTAANPITANPTTSNPTTANPTTANPTTANPTTANPTKTNPTTANPTTPSKFPGEGSLRSQQIMMIIIIVLSLVIVICGVSLYCVHQKHKAKKENKTSACNQNEMSGDHKKAEKKGEQSTLNIFDAHNEAAPIAYTSIASSPNSMENEKEAMDPKQDEGNNATGFAKETDNFMNNNEDLNNNEERDDMDELYINNDASSLNPGSAIDNVIADANDNTPGVSEIGAVEMTKKVLEKVDSLDDLYEPTEDNTPGNVEKDKEEETDKD